MNRKLYQLKHKETGVYIKRKEDDSLTFTFNENEGILLETYPKGGFVTVNGKDILMLSFDVITYKLVEQ